MNNSVPFAAPSQLSIVYRPAGDLIPDPRNARTHPKRQIEQLKASIKAFGFTNPVLADPEGHIIAGHGRDRKSTRLNSSHQIISYAVFCFKKKIINSQHPPNFLFTY